MIDFEARDNADAANAATQQTRAALNYRAGRVPVAIGILGQSNERGNVPLTDKAAYPQAFASLRNPALSVPIGPAMSVSGGYWHYLYDALYDWGYDAQIVNGAIGSASIIKHAAGQISYWNANSGYFAKRAPGNFGDRGYAGDLICPNGNRMFRCVVGNNISALNSGPLRDIVAGSATYLDYIQTTSGAVTGSSVPAAFATAAVGDTIVDGGITWRCESLTAYGSAGGILSENAQGLGWDPLGIAQRLHEEMQRMRGVARRIIYIQNGQSDMSIVAGWYRDALNALTSYFCTRGYEVMIGLTSYSPGSGSTAAYNMLQTDRAASLNYMKTQWPGKVWDGANLYASMGATGPMAAGGVWLQADNIHLNGAGAVGPAVGGIQCAGYYVALAFKAVLAQRTTVN